MSILAEAPQFQSSGELPVINPDRAADIDLKHEAIGRFLRENRYAALLLRRPSNLSWFSSGADFTRQGSAESVASIFVMPEARVVLTNNIESAQVFESQLSGHGFQLKERPWYESADVLATDLCRGRVVASDTPFARAIDVSDKLQALRLPLNPLECERLRELSLHVAHAVEATARQFEHGESEAEISGQLAHRLLRHRVIPERLQVCADGISQRFRHWTPSTNPIERYCTILAVGRRDGLYAAAARTVCFGDTPSDFSKEYQLAVMVQAAGMFFSQAGWTLSETWKRIARIYEKFGHAEEWQIADQAEVLGYEPCEVRVMPNSDFVLQAGMPLFWHPSVGPSLVGDTMLIGVNGVEVLTPMEQWPMIKIDVKGATILRPGILQRVT